MKTSRTAAAVDPLELEMQHAELARRAGELGQAIRRGDPDLARHLDFLQEYAVAHFGAEEEQMLAAGYPGSVRHQAEHDRFVEDLLAFGDAYEERGPAAFDHLRTEAWLSAWLEKHVGGTDAELVRWLTSPPPARG